MRKMPKYRVLAFVVVAIAPFVLWASTYFFCVSITFGVRPYNYDIETIRGGVFAERSFNCLRFESPRIGFARSIEWKKSDYVGWERAHDIEDRFGVMTWRVSYIPSKEAQALDPDLVVTPADDILISFWTIGGLSLIPAGVGCWLGRRQRSKKAEPVATANALTEPAISHSARPLAGALSVEENRRLAPARG